MRRLAILTAILLTPLLTAAITTDTATSIRQGTNITFSDLNTSTQYNITPDGCTPTSFTPTATSRSYDTTNCSTNTYTVINANNDSTEFRVVSPTGNITGTVRNIHDADGIAIYNTTTGRQIESDRTQNNELYEFTNITFPVWAQPVSRANEELPAAEQDNTGGPPSPPSNPYQFGSTYDIATPHTPELITQDTVKDYIGTNPNPIEPLTVTVDVAETNGSPSVLLSAERIEPDGDAPSRAPYQALPPDPYLGVTTGNDGVSFDIPRNNDSHRYDLRVADNGYAETNADPFDGDIHLDNDASTEIDITRQVGTATITANPTSERWAVVLTNDNNSTYLATDADTDTNTASLTVPAGSYTASLLDFNASTLNTTQTTSFIIRDGQTTTKTIATDTVTINGTITTPTGTTPKTTITTPVTDEPTTTNDGSYTLSLPPNTSTNATITPQPPYTQTTTPINTTNTTPTTTLTKGNTLTGTIESNASLGTTTVTASSPSTVRQTTTTTKSYTIRGLPDANHTITIAPDGRQPTQTTKEITANTSINTTYTPQSHTVNGTITPAINTTVTIQDTADGETTTTHTNTTNNAYTATLEPSTYTITVTPDNESYATTSTTTQVTDDTVVNATPAATKPFTLHIENTTGSPINATVTLTNATDGIATTNQVNGNYTEHVPDTTYKAYVNAPGYQPTTTTAANNTTIQLSQSRTITGHITDQANTPVNGTITLTAHDNTTTAPITAGSYHVHAQPNTPYNITLTPERQGLTATTTSINASQARLNATLTAADNTTATTVTIATQDGDPIADADLRNDQTSYTTASDGTATIPVKGSQAYTINADGHTPRRVSLRGNTDNPYTDTPVTQDQTITLQPTQPRTVDAAITGPTPIADATLIYHDPDTGYTASTTTNNDGNATLTGLHDANYTVLIATTTVERTNHVINTTTTTTLNTTSYTVNTTIT